MDVEEIFLKYSVVLKDYDYNIRLEGCKIRKPPCSDKTEDSDMEVGRVDIAQNKEYSLQNSKRRCSMPKLLIWFSIMLDTPYISSTDFYTGN